MGGFDLRGGVSSSGTWTQSAADTKALCQGEIDCHFVIMQSNESQVHISGSVCCFASCVNVTYTRRKNTKWFSVNNLCFNLPALIWQPVTVSDDRRCRRKSSSHFSQARKRGRTMLYQLTRQFSRGGKGEVNLGGVSTFYHSRILPEWLVCFLMVSSVCALICPLQKYTVRACSDMQHPHSWVWIINVHI